MENKTGFSGGKCITFFEMEIPMARRRMIFITLVLVMVRESLSVVASTESINPFNEFMESQEGVDLYSGNAMLEYPIYTLKGRREDFQINLRYSSNVYTNARARNDIAPTGVLGLGWNLSYGSIICDHKETKTHDDDEFLYVSPKGYSDRLVADNDGKFYIKDMPYMLVLPKKNRNNVIIGWEIKNKDGDTFVYGDMDTEGRSNATRYTFCWGKYVKPGFSGTPTLHPYRWDLRVIRDPYGNEVQFQYEPHLEAVRSGNWDTRELEKPKFYTKASYLSSISLPGGSSAHFEYKDKSENEVFDPYIYHGEPDGFMELFESKLLQNIEIRTPGGRKRLSFRLAYTEINHPDQMNAPDYGVDSYFDEGFVKSLLVSIAATSSEGIVGKVTRFTYYADYKESERNPNYNYAALHTIVSPDGGVIEYEYEKQILESTQARTVEFSEEVSAVISGRLPDKKPYVVFKKGENKLPIYEWNGAAWGKNREIVAKDRSVHHALTRNAYLAFTTGDDENLLTIYNYIDGEWVETYPEKNISNIPYPIFLKACGERHIIVECGEHSDIIKVLTWNGNTWNKSLEFFRDAAKIGNENTHIFAGCQRAL